jgi:hypothetical protein
LDGSTDYSRYSNAALSDALARSNPALNPLDWSNVRAEIQRRKLRRRLKMLPIMERVVGWYLLLGALVGLVAAKTAFVSWPISLPAITLPLLLWMAAGGCLLKRLRIGRPLGLLALGFQLLSASFGSFEYRFSPLYGLGISLMNSDIIIRYNLGTEAYLRIGNAVPASVTADIVAAYGMIILTRSLFRARRAAVARPDRSQEALP